MAQSPRTLAEIMATPAMKNKLQEVWGNPTIANTFASSIISIGNGSQAMRRCDPMSIISGAMIAATMQLQIIPTLGQCYLIPYGNKAQAIPASDDSGDPVGSLFHRRSAEGCGPVLFA